MRAAIIGAGVIGGVHYQVCKELGYDVVAVCDIDEKKAQRLSADASAKIFVDYRQMLAEVEADVVHVCTPHYLHAEMIVACLTRNVNVLSEKPLCISKEELSQILAAERNSKAQLGVCLQNRYNPSSVVAKEYLREHKAYNGFATMVWHRDKSYYQSAAWRGKLATEGGGAMINQALHPLDLMQWLMGMPTHCAASVSNLTLQGCIEVEDTAVGIFSGEHSFTMVATVGSEREFPVELTFLTEGGVLRVLPDRVDLDGRPLSLPDTNPQGVLGKSCYGTGHRRLIEAFYTCVQKGEKFPIDGTEGGKVVSLILAMYESQGKKVEVDYVR